MIVSTLIFFASLYASLLTPLHAATEIPVARHYRAFGPLPYTSSSLGINPLKAISNSIPTTTTLLSLDSFPSESAIGGYAKWRDVPYNHSAKGVISAPFPDADPSLPYDAIAVANFTVRSPTTTPRLIQCSDPAIIKPLQLGPEHQHIIDQHSQKGVTNCPSDPYEDGRLLCSIQLYPGTYQIFVTSSAIANVTNFFCNYFTDPAHQPPRPSLLHPIDDTVTPTIVVQRSTHPPTASFAGPHCSVTVMNIHPSLWASKGSAEIRNAPEGLHFAAQSQADSHYPLPRIAPRQVRQLRIDFATDQHFLRTALTEGPLPDVVNVTLAVTYHTGDGAAQEAVFELSFDVAVWRESRSYHFTYIDVDGSVQAAAVLPPKNKCVGAPAGHDSCSVLLSTHGAGVDAVSEAWTDSYRTQVQSWVLLPTGRRKFGLNWEGPQMTTAVTALRALASGLPGVPAEEKDEWKVRADFWLQAGHSMGGHGALLLSTHFPDMLVAALPAMGWLRLSSYGSRRYSEQLPHSDAAMRALLTVSSAEYSADLYVENLLGIPFLARVGTEDDNVPPSKLRRFCRLLKESEALSDFKPSVVALSEVPGKGHWFDGVVDDDKLQPFIEGHLKAASKPTLPQKFVVFTMNPASTGSRGGLRIMSLEVPFQQSRLRVERNNPENGTWTVNTENVRRFRFQPVHGVLERPQKLIVDSSEGAIPVDAESLASTNSYMDVCATQSARAIRADARPVAWRRCHDEMTWASDRSKERGPDTSGPSAQVLAGRKLVVVFPEGDSELQDTAVAYANSLYLRGISAQVTTDSNVSVGQLNSAWETNKVLFGGPHVNRMSQKLYADGFVADVSFDGNQFCVSSRCYQSPGTGIAFLSPGPKRSLLFYVAGTSREGLLSALSFLPSSPASNVPEWVVVSKHRGWGVIGFGGIIGLGYWDHEWRLEIRKSYPSEFAFDLKKSGVTCAPGQERIVYERSYGALITIMTALLIFLIIYCIKRRQLPMLIYKRLRNGIQEDKRRSSPDIEKEVLLEEDKS